MRLPLADPGLLSDGDWLGLAGTGSDSVVPTVPPVSVRKKKKDWVIGYGKAGIYVCAISDNHIVLPINNPSVRLSIHHSHKHLI